MLGSNRTRWSLAALLQCSASLLTACTEEDVGPPEPSCAVGQTCVDASASGGLDASVITSPEAGSWDAGSSVASDLPCDVKAVIDKHCAVCHTAAGSAPMPLTRRADFLAASPKEAPKTVADTLPVRVSTSDTISMMPPAGYPRPSAAELSTLNTWLSSGALAENGQSGASCDSVPPDGGMQPVGDDLECYRFLAHDGSKKAKYKVGIAWDVYVNMTFKAPWPDTRYGVIMRPIVDNAKAIHHWLLFQNSLPGVDGLVAPAVGAHPDGALLVAWAPGGTGLDLSKWPDVAYELPGGEATYTMEFHYNSDDPNAVDASGVEVCMLKSKPKNIAAVSWLGKDNLGLPESKWIATCDPLSEEPIRIMGVMPHMHLAGTHMKSVINRKDGSKETLHDEDFNFEYQRNYDKDVTLMPGDTITTECTYSKPTVFGKATTAEMCYLFTYAYPRGALANLDPWGAFAHGGSSCLGL